ncbi:MAG TPA: 2Fe-2S iron-sulfur cluster-binding protein [Ktedonobacterales bacterium]
MNMGSEHDRGAHPQRGPDSFSQRDGPRSPGGSGWRQMRDSRASQPDYAPRGRSGASGEVRIPPREPNPTSHGLPLASPTNMLPVRVAGRQEVAPDVVSVAIVLPGARQAPAPYLPGQFVTLALPTSRETLYRSYSLCGAGDPSEPWELTIKRVENGAVSNYFYEHVVPGTLLYSSLPRGVFTLPGNLSPEMTLTMVAVGSGITPIIGMLRAIARMRPNQRPSVQLYYASRSAPDIIFRDELRTLDEQQSWLIQRHFLSSRGDRLSVDAMLAHATAPSLRGHWYMCGPTALTAELAAGLSALGVKESHIHAEVFATAPGPAYRIEPDSEADEASGAGAHIQIADTGMTIEAQPRETILAALERHSYRPDYSCRAGACGACKLRLLQGQATPAGEILTPSELAAGYVLSCIARPMGDVTLASGGRPPKGVTRVGGAPAPGRSRRAVQLARLTAVMGVSGLLIGTWNLTNHRPASWPQPAVSAGTPASPTGAPGSPRPGATTQSGAGGPSPTATPRPKSPAPKPVATSTPSKTGG